MSKEKVTIEKKCPYCGSTYITVDPSIRKMGISWDGSYPKPVDCAKEHTCECNSCRKEFIYKSQP